MKRCSGVFPRRVRIGCVMLALAGSTATQAVTYTVGSPVGPGQCSHGTIQSAINAAHASAGADTIRLTRSLTYEPETNSVDTNQELTIEGGYATCTQVTADGTRTIVSGDGGATEPVFRVVTTTGALVRLRMLTIRGGDEDGSGKGGGIYFRGNGILHVSNSDVINNIAGYGAGIYAEGTGSDAELVIGEGVTIAGNAARYSGGGVYADQVEMSMLEPGSILFNNRADGIDGGGYGGGLVVHAGNRPSYAYVGSGLGTLGAIYGNSARYGGGVAIGGRSTNDGSVANAELQLFTTDASRLAKIAGNNASSRGGAIHIRSFSSQTDGDVIAVAKLWNAVLDDNGAPAGAAVYVEASEDPAFLGRTFGSFRFNDLDGPDPWPPLASVACAAGADCGRITGNVANTGSPSAGEGSIIHGEAATEIVIGGKTESGAPSRGGVAIRDNRGRHLIGNSGSGETHYVSLRNVLVGDNEFSDDLLRSTNGTGYVRVFDSTIAGNTIGGGDVLWTADKPVDLKRSIVWQPGVTTVGRSGGSLVLGDLIASELASLVGGGLDVIRADPRFVDPAHGDYRLRAGSPAIDYAPPVTGDDRDVFGLARDQDMTLAADERGVRDIGAFERQSLQPMVLNADFDDADLRLWTWYAGEWDGTQNAAGDGGSGSWKYAATGVAQPRVFVAQQCVHLPGPGRYRLDGRGRGGGSTIATRDYAVAVWEFRRDGTDDCNVGTADRSGEVTLGWGTSWGRPAQPAVIEVPPFEWGNGSSITITLTAVDGGITAPRSISAWFDGITLDIDTDTIFANGFE